MKKLKPLPLVDKAQYEVAPELSQKTYKLTAESQEIRDNLVHLILKQRAAGKVI